jgi:hypothetical protein
MTKPRFSPNLDGKGRLLRAVLALGLFIGAGFGFTSSIWLGLALFVAGLFVAFEAVRGWCVVRACGIKTLI